MSNFKFFFFSAKSSKFFFVGEREDRNGIQNIGSAKTPAFPTKSLFLKRIPL